jgi:hypothetical protein
MNLSTWVGQVAAAACSHNAGELMARLNWMDATARTCVQSARLNAAQLDIIVARSFSSSRVDNADKWATLAAEHLKALQLCHNGKHLVRN